MTIDYTTVRLYTCCKCGHKWTNWDRLKQQDSESIPGNCPKCRNVRWNQGYTDEDITLIKKLEEQHIIRHEAKKEKSMYAAILGKDENVTHHYYEFDFVAYDFLYSMIPDPDIFEIRQVLKIPKSRIEDRHELMISMMRDRMINKERYEREHFSKISEYSRSKRSNYNGKLPIHELLGNVRSRRRMKGCKCKEEVDLLVHLYKNHIYHVGSEPGFDMTHSPKVLKLPGSETVEAEAAIKAIEVNKAELEALWKKHWEFFKAKYMGPGYHNTEENAERVADGIIRDWKKDIAARKAAAEARRAKWDAEEAERDAKRLASLTEWAKKVFQEGRDAGHADNEIAEEVKKTALDKNYSESEINQALQEVEITPSPQE